MLVDGVGRVSVSDFGKFSIHAMHSQFAFLSGLAIAIKSEDAIITERNFVGPM